MDPFCPRSRVIVTHLVGVGIGVCPRNPSGGNSGNFGSLMLQTVAERLRPGYPPERALDTVERFHPGSLDRRRPTNYYGNSQHGNSFQAREQPSMVRNEKSEE